jgi:hypothetical protein
VKPLAQRNEFVIMILGLGNFGETAHRQCNARYFPKEKIPIIMHNFKQYDCHLLLKGMQKFSEGKVTAIPVNSEKFLSIICDKYVFLDSMMFLSASLDELVRNLLGSSPTKDYFKNNFKVLDQVFGSDLGMKLARKGVYPYEYMNCWSRFEECDFPSFDEFYSTLNGKNVNADDYEFGKYVFENLCTTMGDYHDLYLLLDSILLACVFENFREVALTHYKLDPCHYFSLAGYAWDAALLSTKKNLKI